MTKTADRRAPTPSPTRRTETVGDLEFRILSSPRHGPNAPAYVLVHGIGMSHRYLARLHRQLSRTDAVHSVDLPGFGGLPTPAGDISVPGLSRALGVVLDRLGIADAVLVGHSMGAQWVIELGLQRPDLAARVVVIGPVCDDRYRTVTSQSMALAIDTLGEPIDGNLTVFTDYLRCGPRWYLTQLRHMIAYSTESRAAALTRPLLVVRGAHDPIAGLAWCRRLRDSTADGSLVIVPGKRHLAQHTAPRAVADALRTFVADPSLRGRSRG